MAESAGERVTDEAIWQSDIVRGFNKENDSIFPFVLKGQSGCPEEHGHREARLETKVFPSRCSRAESFAGSLNWNSSRGVERSRQI